MTTTGTSTEGPADFTVAIQWLEAVVHFRIGHHFIGLPIDYLDYEMMVGMRARVRLDWRGTPWMDMPIVTCLAATSSAV